MCIYLIHITKWCITLFTKKAIYDITMTDWLQKRLQKKRLQIDYKNTTEKEYNIDYKKDYKKDYKTAQTLLGLC